MSINDKETTYAKNDIKKIKIDAPISAPPPPPKVKSSPKMSTESIIKVGTIIHVKTSTQIDTNSHQEEHQFTMNLDSDIADEQGNTLVKKGSDIYGVVVSLQQARRLVGESKMIITLSAISVNSQRISIKTNSINILTPHKQGKDTGGKVLRGAAIGALVNGRNGAKVGLGAAILTRGRATGVPAGTLLDFTTAMEVSLK